jgi:hypothetical protein
LKPGNDPGKTRGRALRALFAVALLTLLPACRRDGGVAVTRESPPGAAAPPPAISGKAVAGERVPAGLTAAEARAVRAFLAAHPTWRLAGDSDSRPSDDADDVGQLYGVYHPYFVRGDLDDDGTLDFAAAFVDREKKSASPWFSVAAFCGDGRGGFRPPQLIESEISLEAGDLSIDRDSIVITPDLSEDDASRRYRWNPHQKRFDFVSDQDSSPDRPPSSRI